MSTFFRPAFCRDAATMYAEKNTIFFASPLPPLNHLQTPCEALGSHHVARPHLVPPASSLFLQALVNADEIPSFHVDHAASLPYVLAKTNFRGRVFMTHPTKAIYKWLIQDSVRVGNTSSNPTSQPALHRAGPSQHLPTDRSDRLPHHPYRLVYPNHSLPCRTRPGGGDVPHRDCWAQHLLYGRLLARARPPPGVRAKVPQGVKIDVLITESTYGIASHIPRLEREQALMKSVTGILNRGGRVLMPVFALGRAQELLLILDEYWGKHPEYQKYPIYYASNLARKCMLVYQTYIGAMNDNIKRLFRERMAEAESSGDGVGKGGPWDFGYIRSLKNLDRFDDVGGCVMLASPGMLQSGVSQGAPGEVGTKRQERCHHHRLQRRGHHGEADHARARPNPGGHVTERSGSEDGSWRRQ